ITEFRAPTSIEQSQPPRKPPAKFSATETSIMDSLESLFSLRGHRGLVTGASSRLGVECAKALAIGGADVALVARRKDRVVQIAHDFAKAHGVKAIGTGADVTREDALDRVMAEASSALGALAILVKTPGGSPT